MKFLTSVILITFSAVAAAQSQAHLDVQTSVQKQEVIVNDAGESETRLVAAELVVPGDRMIAELRRRGVRIEEFETEPGRPA